MQRILVVYYSRTGHTQQVAEAIASTFDADLEAIGDVKSRLGLLGSPRSAVEGLLGRLTGIRKVEKDLEQYDLVVLGTPIWSGNMSSPMRTYLTQQHGKFRQVAFFCTEGGIGGKRAFRQMAKIVGRDPIATMIITQRELRSEAYDGKVAQFVAQIEGHQAAH